MQFWFCGDILLSYEPKQDAGSESDETVTVYVVMTV